MASKAKKAAGWGFRLAAVFITLLVAVGVFAYVFHSTGNEMGAMLRAAIPVVAAVLVSYALGSIDKINHKRWQIYLTVLLLVALFVCLRIAGWF